MLVQRFNSSLVTSGGFNFDVTREVLPMFRVVTLTSVVLALGFRLYGQVNTLKLSVPVVDAKVRDVRFRHKPIEIVSRMEGPGTRIVILPWATGEADHAITSEVEGALDACPRCFDDVKIWSTGREPRAFRVLRQQMTSREVLDTIVESYALGGPLEIYWIDVNVSWLDCRQVDWCYHSLVKESEVALGNAGATLYPIVVPVQGRAIGDMGFARSITGSTIRMADRANPGQALASALRESTRHTTLELRRSAVRGSGDLEIFDENRKLIYRRPFAFGQGENTSIAPVNLLETKLYPFVPTVSVTSARLARSCLVSAEGVASAGRAFVRLEGVHVPGTKSSEKAESFEVMVSRKDVVEAQATSGLTVQMPRTRWLQRGTTACIGPIDVDSSMDLTLMEVGAKWMAKIALRSSR